MKKSLILLFLVAGLLSRSYPQCEGTKTFSLDDIEIDTIGEFQLVKLPDCSFIDEPGKPKLPVFHLKFAIPHDAAFDTVVINSKSTEQIAGEFYIYPAQEEIITDGRPAPPFSDPDSIVYNSNDPFPPEEISDIRSGYMYGYHIITLQYAPIVYYPQDSSLFLCTDLDFEIQYSAGQENFTLPKKITLHRKEFLENLVSSMVENGDDVYGFLKNADEVVEYPYEILEFTFNPNSFGIIPEYVIISNPDPDIIEAFGELADWKTKKGVPAVIVTTEYINDNYYGIDLAEKMRNYLKDCLSNWGPGFFALLGGDVDIVPSRKSYKRQNGFWSTDLYFSALDGTWNANGNQIFGEESDDETDLDPDIFVGRAPVSNAAEAVNFINKVISYEKMESTIGFDEDFVKNTIFASGFLWLDHCPVSPGINSCEIVYSFNMIDILEYIIHEFMPMEINENVWTIYDNPFCKEGCYKYCEVGGPCFCCLDGCIPADEALHEDTLFGALNNTFPSTINRYPHIIFHIDHSGPYTLGAGQYFYGSSLNVSEIIDLSNTSVYPYYQIMVSDGCECGTFDEEDCIGECYVKNTNGGGVAFIGNSGLGGSGQIIEFRDFCDAIYDLPGHPALGYNLGLVYNNSINNITSCKSKKTPVLLGEPEMPVWTNTIDGPGPISVTVDPGQPEIYTGSNDITVSVDNIPSGIPVTACFYKENEVYAIEYAVGTGDELIMNFNIIPNSPGDLYLTVTAHNFRPVEMVLQVFPNPGVHLYISDFIFTDPFGEPVTTLNAGETFNLDIQLMNSGLTDATNVFGELSSDVFEMDESFEGFFPPEEWSLQGTAQYWHQADITQWPQGYEPPDQDFLIYFNAHDIPDGETQVLKTKEVFLFNSKLYFKMLHDDQFCNNDRIQLLVHLNGQDSPPYWQEIPGATFYRYDPNGTGWVDYIVDLNMGTLNHQYCLLGFEGISDNNSEQHNDIHIDKVELVNSYIEINENFSLFGNINSGQSNSSQNQYEFIIDPWVPQDWNNPFNLDITADAGNYNRSDHFYQEFNAPDLELFAVNYITENNDKIFEADELVYIDIEIRNVGDATAKEVTGTLTSISPYIGSIPNPNGNYQDIAVHSGKKNSEPFVILLNNSQPTSIALTITLQDVYGKQWVFNISLSNFDFAANIDFRPHEDHINFFWTKESSAIGYNIYRFIDDEWQRLNSDILNYTWFNDDLDLVPYTEYEYRLTYLNQSFTESNKYSFTAWTSLAYHSGWPFVYDWENLGKKNHGSPSIANIDESPGKEIFIPSYGSKEEENVGGILGYHEDGTKIFPTTNSGFYDFSYSGLRGTPSVADVDNDGIQEIIAATNENNGSSGDGKKLFVFSSQDNDLDGIPDIKWTENIKTPNYKGIAIGNVDNSTDGINELFKVNFYSTSDINNNVPDASDMVLYSGTDGSVISGWPQKYPLTPLGIEYMSYAMPAIADLEGDGAKEIIVAFKKGLYIYNFDGTQTSVVELDLSDEFRMDAPPVLADIDDDGILEIIVIKVRLNNTEGDHSGNIIAYNPDGSYALGWSSNSHQVNLSGIHIGEDNWYGLFPSPSVGDIDHDNKPEIFFADRALYGWDSYGAALDNFPIEFDSLKAEDNFTVPLIADVDEDDELEIIVASNYGLIYAVNPDGSRVKGFPLSTDYISSPPCIDDVDFDGKNELFVAAGREELHLWDTDGDANLIEWGHYRHDSYNPGFYGHQLPCAFSGIEIPVQGNTTWNEDQILTQSVRVYPGVELTITARIALPEDATIIVERGARLVIDGGTLTNACNGLWRGIELWGTAYQPQNIAYQGIVEVLNGGKIENAVCGIKTIRMMPNGEGVDPDYSGGIIWADNAGFINNKTAVEFYNYPEYQSISHFYRSAFETTRNLLEDELPEYFIKMTGVEGINIRGCEFKNSRLIETCPYAQRGTGIYSLNAHYYVWEFESGQETWQTKFENLMYGIKALGISTDKTITVKNTLFSKNCRSFYVSAISNAEIIFNEFVCIDVPESFPSYGLYLDNCTGYTVEENQFEGDSSPEGIGMVINNSGDNNNEIYNNSFSGLNYATLAQNCNRGYFDWQGLIIKCNDYWENYQDIAVTADEGIELPGIARNQGAEGGTEMQAGNRFSLNDNSNEVSDYSSIHPAPINYYHHNPEQSNEPRVKPVYFSDDCIYLFQQDNYFIKDVSCESNFSGGGGGSGEDDLLMSMETNGFKADSTQAILSALVDGGNTEVLEQEVLQSMPPDAYDLYMSLMGKSPYLSDSVLIAAIEKENVLPNVLLKDILVANPQAAKSTEVMDKVDEKSNPMIPEMVAEILLGKYLIAAKENLEAKLSYYRQQRSNALKYLKQLYRNDSVDPFIQDTLIYMLENEPGLQEKYELVQEYAKQENWQAAMTLLGNLPAMYSFDSYRQEAYDDHCQLFNIYHQLYLAGYGLDSLSEVQKSTLEQLADNAQNFAGSYSRNILIETNGYEYTEPVLLPETGPKSGNIVFDLPAPADFTPEYVKIFPNPAKDIIIVELLTGNVNGATIRVFDIQGKPVRIAEIPAKQQHYVLHVEDLHKGIYYLKVELNGKTLESKKFSKVN